MGEAFYPFELVNTTTGQSVTAEARHYYLWRDRIRGLMFRRSIPEDAAYIFPYADIGRRGVHMLFVFEPLDVLWLQRGEVHQKETLKPFFGYAAAHADAFIEFPAGGADGVRVGDKLSWGPR